MSLTSLSVRGCGGLDMAGLRGRDVVVGGVVGRVEGLIGVVRFC